MLPSLTIGINRWCGLLAPAHPSRVLPDRLLQMDVAGKRRMFSSLAHVRSAGRIARSLLTPLLFGSGPSRIFVRTSVPSRTAAA